MSDRATDFSLRGEPLAVDSWPPRNPINSSPVRRPHSARRTSTIYADWPNGRDGQMRLQGRARDLITGRARDVTQVAAEHAVEAWLDGRVIQAVTADPPRAVLDALVGARGGGHLRSELLSVLYEEHAAGAPLYLVLDDVAGVSLIAGWAWSQWSDIAARLAQDAHRDERLPQMEGVCIGFRPGSRALQVEPGLDAPTILPPLVLPEDPTGWHRFPVIDGANLRRARRIDVWREGGAIHIDATFQDSAARPDGMRAGLHEYRLVGTADERGQRLTALEALPQILPYRECAGAIQNVFSLVGTPMADLRASVLERLPRTLGCTHLNDALRALAEVPRLVSLLPTQTR
ncbi:DUF2889 domain-containing protein (plasmid) [Sphingobium sp. JS3065]|uniref:DUF2889 domain-containing protein n=1 Tax=Sphingobium sp. JS3065 TaxID=2970925 RepID=UPI0022655B79|nr:DUF2889 domain-containing protein [Sphingobium sp. JS3065]UZW58286.1 DUF2889 domain-containing protein [Sphingobium sp. JS3065]